MTSGSAGSTGNSGTEQIQAGIAIKRESRKVEYKREFDPAVPGAWLELLKDVAAIANSGGGVIVIGLENDGSPSGWDPTVFLSTDEAVIVDAWAKYIGEQFDGFEVREVRSGRRRLAAVLIPARTVSPLTFEKPGTYADGGAKQRTAFAKGTVYFRHGAKSEAASSRDVARFIEREVGRQRKAWLGNIRKVTSAPKDASVFVVPAAGRAAVPTNVRVTDDPSAPAAIRTDFDQTHPHRQTEVVAGVNQALAERVVNSYDIQCVRRVHSVAERAEFFHKPKFGSPQYSQAFVEWLVEQYKIDNRFFDRAKTEARTRTDSRASRSREDGPTAA